MDNELNTDIYWEETRPGRSILIPFDVSARPGVPVSPHMISLLDQSCKDCQEMYIDYDNLVSPIPIRAFFHLHRATPSAKLCPLCMLARMIWNHFSEDPPSSKVRIFGMHLWPRGSLTLQLRCDEYDWGRHFRNNDGFGDSPRSESIQLDFTELGDSGHPVDQPHGVACSPNSPAGIAKLKEWIQTCDSEHTNCSVVHDEFGSTTQNFVPTRLIMLASSSNKHARLVSLTEPVHYVALSYCWGSSEQLKTTKINVKTRKRNILITELPKTLQDAITMTQALDLKYLWIDSLCIIQDDEHDWAIESSKMADIYSNAWLVLAATGAPDCASGMLQSREPPLIIPPNWQLETTAFISARRLVSHNVWGAWMLETQPLWQRAWAMQERELARRIVHFLPDELMWHCQTSIWCECGIAYSSRKSISPLSRFAKLNSTRSHVEQDLRFGDAWIAVLREYSRLKMTTITDRLPALSGLAKYVEHLIPGQYIAGLWERGIALQLAWYTFPTPSSSAQLCKPNSLSGPSFSWTATKRHIRWDPTVRDSYESSCTLVTSATRLATANPYGHILTSSITLTGHVLGAPELRDILKEDSRESVQHRTKDENSIFGKWGSMDDPHCDLEHLLEISSREAESHGIVVVGMILYQYRSSFRSGIMVSVVLLLQRDATATAYKRIGLIPELFSANISGEKPVEIITIM